MRFSPPHSQGSPRGSDPRGGSAALNRARIPARTARASTRSAPDRASRTRGRAVASEQGTSMHRYRSHTCGELRAEHVGETVRLSGWAHRIRDHGGLLFIDLRDHYGITQCVADPDSPAFRLAETVRAEWVVRVDGKVRKRPEGTENADLPTGMVEVYITELEVLGPAAELPMPVF